MPKSNSLQVGGFKVGDLVTFRKEHLRYAWGCRMSTTFKIVEFKVWDGNEPVALGEGDECSRPNACISRLQHAKRQLELFPS